MKLKELLNLTSNEKTVEIWAKECISQITYSFKMRGRPIAVSRTLENIDSYIVTIISTNNNDIIIHCLK